MATLTVGQGQQYSTISAAINASHDGDVVQVQAGTYNDDFATINTKITLQGVGGMVKLTTDKWVDNDKGIFVVNNDVTVDHFEFTGASGSSGNAAGIRYQSGNLTVTNSYFHDNQNGILANPNATGTISISNSEFAHNGTGDGYTHNLYVGDIAKLTVTDSYFHDAIEGNEIKSRAEVTEITNNRIYDNDGTASYSIDIPNGGQATITGNTIQQGANTHNPNIVEFGAEGSLHDTNSVTMTGNTVVNELTGSPSTMMFWNAAGAPATVSDNQVWGLTSSQLTNGTANVSGTTFLSSEPGLDTSSPIDGSSSAPTSPSSPSAPSAPATPSSLIGTSGNDVLSATGSGDTHIRGAEGDDSIAGNAAHNDINGNQGQDTIVGHSSVGDWLLGGQGSDSINAVQSTGANIMNGNIGADTVVGGAGADIVRGGQGDDVLKGAQGNDWLSGDMGHNTVTGGAGADTFHAGANAGVSVVTDFNGGDGDRVFLDSGVQYHLSQQGADLHVVLDNGLGGDVVLQNTAQTSFQSGWII
jgi:Ca2+-binding RTX toxin-like protein